jgi:hypothetical protein
MDDAVLEKLKFPIGKFQWIDRLSDEKIKFHTQQIRNFPTELEEQIQALTPEDFKKPYRPGGWQIGQLIHHLADSHMHCYIRFKQALIQDTPAIMDYDQDQWAVLPDALILETQSSIKILKGIHKRWADLMETLNPKQWERQYYHPNRDKHYPLATVLALYAWHGQHHLAHIRDTL